MGYALTGRTESSSSQVPEDDNLQRSGLPTPPEDPREHSDPAMALPLPGRITDLSPEAEPSTASRSSSPPVASTSTSLHSPQDESQLAPYRSNRASTFRHVPLRNSTPSSPLNSQRHTPAPSLSTSISTSKNGALSHENSSTVLSMRPPNTLVQTTVNPLMPFLDSPGSIGGARHQSAAPAGLALPTVDAPTLQYVSRVSTPSTIHKATALTSSSTSVPQRIAAPYRPGFQPRGVYRLLTDDFVALRQAKQEVEGSKGEHGMSRAERRKLERRFEKLIAIHFPLPSEKSDVTATKGTPQERPGLSVGRSENRRVSSFADFDFGSITIQDAGDMWRGIFGSDEAATIRGSFRL
jgi:rabenosyn-5